MNPTGANRINDLVSRLLDQGYEQAAQRVLRAVAASTTSGVIATRLNQLEAEAQRLAKLNQRLTADNPILVALTADLERVMRQNAQRLADGAEDIQRAGVDAAATLTRELALPGMSAEALARIGVRWNVPNPEAVMQAVGYVESDAWASELSKYVRGSIDVVNNQAILGMIHGWNPVKTARMVREKTQGFTVAQANNLMRTLQLTSYRDAAAMHQSANADILSGQIRIGTLDDRICLACIALHGTFLPAGQRVDDHHQGRCVGVPIVRGVNRVVTTGEDWFNSLPEERRRSIAGEGAFELLQSGRATIRDFVQDYSDPVFGQMVRRASNEFVEQKVGAGR